MSQLLSLVIGISAATLSALAINESRKPGPVGPQGLQGPQGFSTGSIYFLNYDIVASNPKPAAPPTYYNMNRNILSIGTQTLGPFSQNGAFGYFLSDPLDPLQAEIPSGVWTLHQHFSAVTQTGVPSTQRPSIYLALFVLKDTGTIVGPIASNVGSPVPLQEANYNVWYDIPISVVNPYALDLTDRIIVVQYLVDMGYVDLSNRWNVSATYGSDTPAQLTTTLSPAIEGPSGPTGPQGLTGATGPQGATGPILPTGNTLTVDSVFGDDSIAAADRYVFPFQTISSALALATSGENVLVRAGIYNETLTVPAGVSLTGEAPQAVVIQKLGVTASTTLLTLNQNCRAENFTANLSSSGNFNLVGCDFVTGASINAKLRNSIWTITSTATGNPTIVGVRSAGTSSTAYTAANAIQRSTINVISSSTGITRGILVSGPNRFAVRDIVVFARGTGTNIGGAETTNASAVLDIKTSTIGGTLYDINRSLGIISIGATDLQNNNANGNGFSVSTEPSKLLFVLGPQVSFSGQGSVVETPIGTYYLSPGTSIANFALTVVGIPFGQGVIIFDGVISSTITIPNGTTVTVNLYKSTNPNVLGTLFKSEVLNNAIQNKVINNFSTSFTTSDFFQAQCIISGGSLTAGTNICIALGIF